MKISYLKIENFREVRSMDLRNLTAATILTGPNGAGKTTVLDAIRVCLAGQCYDQTGKRIPTEDLIGLHAKTATIDLGVEIAGKAFSLFLTIKKSGTSLTAKDARSYEAYPGAESATKIRAAICEALGTDLARIECAVNPRAYLLGPELGNMLAELCAGAVDTDQLRRASGDHWEYVAKLATEARVEMDATGLVKLGDAAYKRRTEVNKHVAVAEKAIADHAGIEQPVDTKGRPMEYAQMGPLLDLLTDLKTQRDALIAERGRVESIGSAEDIKKQVKAAEKALKKASSTVGTKAALAEKAASNARELDKVAQDAYEGLKGLERQYDTAQARYNTTRAALDAMNLDAENCPHCKQVIPEDVRDAMLRPLENALEEAKGAVAAINLEQAQKACTDFKRDRDAALAELEKAREELRAAEADLAEKERDLARIPDVESMKSLDTLNAEITTIDTRCENGEAKVDALTKWSEFSAAKQSLDELHEELNHLEWAIMAFRDGEFLKAQLSDSKGDFESSCNAVLAPYGYKLAVEVAGKHVQVTMWREGHRPAPLAQCSKGELVLAGWAVATAFSGESLICIDDMDALFGPTKNLLLKSLAHREAEAPVIIAGAWTAGKVDLDPIRTALPGASVVWVEGGEAKTQGVQVAA